MSEMVRLKRHGWESNAQRGLLGGQGQRDNRAAHLNSLRVLLQPVINLRHREGRLSLLYAVTGKQRREED